MRWLAISGSLRAQSSNTTALRIAASLAPPDVEVVFYGNLGGLPHFNPDLDTDLDDPNLPLPVRDLRMQVAEADAVVISSPEYAHGVPGSLKNALDWLVGGREMPGKPVALLNASPRSTHAQASLAETLRTMSVRLVEGSPFAVPLSGRSPDDPEVAGAVQALVTAVYRSVKDAGSASG